MTVFQINQWLKAKKIKVEAKKIRKINNGFTNAIYKVLGVDGKYYKLRIAIQNEYINRKLEHYIEMQLNSHSFLYYDVKTGNYFREWYIGKHPKKRNWNQAFFDRLCDTIKSYQALKVPTDLNILYPRYIDDVEEIKDTLPQELATYKSIIKTFNSNDLVISHNDFSCNNLVITKDGQFHLYDFEWSTLNHKLWDISNMIKDLDLSIEKICKIAQIQANLYEYVKIIFAVHFYTLFWTYRVAETPKIIRYRKHIMKRTKYWYQQIKLIKPDDKAK